MAPTSSPQTAGGPRRRLTERRDIRRLLIIGAMAVIQAAKRSAPPEGAWLARMLARKPRMLVAIALANKMARGVWAMMTKQEDYRDPATAAA